MLKPNEVTSAAARDRSVSLRTLGEQVDRLITVCTRHQYHWGATTRLYDAAYRKLGRPLTLAAAEHIANTVGRNDTVIISAGWVKHPFHPLGEFDGYAGAAALARAINLGLGARALIVTDEVCVEPFRQVLHAAEMKVWDYQRFFDVIAFHSTSVIAFPVDVESGRQEAVDLMDQTQAKVLIAVERSDATERGTHHDGGGGDMTSWQSKVHLLFREAYRRGVPTIGCFDIGNEIGGASVREAVVEVFGALGQKIVGATETSVGVVGRSSNAAAYGIAACLAGILGRSEILHSRELQRHMMDVMMRIPLADGPTLLNGFTEDGAPGELTLGLLDTLHWLVQGAIDGEGFPWERPPFA